MPSACRLSAVGSLVSCRALKEAERKTPGFQRLRMAQYDDLRKKLISSHGTRALKGEVRCCCVQLLSALLSVAAEQQQ